MALAIAAALGAPERAQARQNRRPTACELSRTQELEVINQEVREMLATEEKDFETLPEKDYRNTLMGYWTESSSLRAQLARAAFKGAHDHPSQKCVHFVKSAILNSSMGMPVDAANAQELDDQLPSYGFLKYHRGPNGLPIGPRRDGTFGQWTSLNDAPPGVIVTYRGRTPEEEAASPFYSDPTQKANGLKGKVLTTEQVQKKNENVTHAEVASEIPPPVVDKKSGKVRTRDVQPRGIVNSDFRQKGAITGADAPLMAPDKKWVFSAAWFPTQESTRSRISYLQAEVEANNQRQKEIDAYWKKHASTSSNENVP